jgi:drug/metabolite transporter (DMT)-like permease
LTVTAIALILVAAVAHASWNLFSKQASTAGAGGFVWLMAVSASVGYGPLAAAVIIIQRPHLTALNWAFMAGTGVLQAGYFLFLQNGYRLGDLSLVYPIGRGTGALLAALAGIILLGERPGPAGITGILLIVAGVVVLGLPAQARRAPAPHIIPPVPDMVPPVPGASAARVTAASPDGGPRQAPSAASPHGAARAPSPAGPAAPAPLAGPAGRPGPAGGPGPAGPPPRRNTHAAPSRPAAKAMTFAGLTGMFIASYTVWDKHAVTTLHTPPLLQAYAAFPIMAVAFAPLALRDRPRIAELWRSYRPQVLGAAVLAPLAYILVLIALKFTAVSAVAPAREVSVLFGVLLGGRLLGEASLARRLGGAAAIVAGIVAVAIG